MLNHNHQYLYIIPTDKMIRDALSFLTTLENTTVNLEIILTVMLQHMSDLDHVSTNRNAFFETMVDIVSKNDSIRFADYMVKMFDELLDLFLQFRLWDNPENLRVRLVFHRLHHYNIVVLVSRINYHAAYID